MTGRDRINALFEELVPASGPAETVAGEIIRATCRIGYRFWNDGDQVGIGYGKETCNPAWRYLSKHATHGIQKILNDIWGLYNEDLYEKALEILYDEIADLIDRYPELKTAKNEDDMWNYYDENEDRDDEEDEDDYWG